MKAHSFLFITALLFSLPLFSNASSCGDLMGQVINLDTHKPVGNAEVIFENYYYKLTVTANEYGFYNASHLPEGRYQMRVVYNKRTFAMNHVKVYDSYANEINFFVSSSDTLPSTVTEITPDPIIKIFQQNDIVLNNASGYQATLSLSDVLMTLPGVNIFEGRLYIKGYSRGAEAKVFIDGTPVIAPVVFNK